MAVEIEITHPKHIPKQVLKRITCPTCKKDVFLTMYTKIHCPCGKNPSLNLVLLAENLAEFRVRRVSFHRDD